MQHDEHNHPDPQRQCGCNDERHLSDIVTPPLWDQIASPPVGVLDGKDLEDEWLNPFDDGGSPPKYFSFDPVQRIDDKPMTGVVWQGRQWCTTVRGCERRDGTHVIPFAELWIENSIRSALATKGDAADLKEALRLCRRLDRYFDCEVA
jgi:hypothetical protein